MPRVTELIYGSTENLSLDHIAQLWRHREVRQLA